MAIQQLLDSLRRDHPACHTVAFGDLSSDLVLCVSADRKPPQEQLDRLIRQARALLDGPAGAAAAAALAGPEGVRPDLALVDTAAGARLFLRSSAEPADALCCLCAPESDAGALIAAARKVLRRIAGDAAGEAGA